MPKLPKNRQNANMGMDERRRVVTELYLAGHTQSRIAEQVGVSQQTVSVDLQAIRDLWVATAIVNFDEARAMELAKLDNMERVAWDAWERSCQPAEMTHTKTEQAVPLDRKGKGKEAKPSKPELIPIKVIEEVKRTGQVGNPAFLERVAWCIEMRCKLLNLVKQQAPSGGVTINLNWDDLLAKPERSAADDIEAAINNPRLITGPPTNGAGNGHHNER